MNEIVEQMIDGSKDIADGVIGLLKELDETVYSPEIFGLGLGLLAMGTVGLTSRHPEMAMFLAAETGDVAQEFLGNLTNAADIDVQG
jgi:hypothetical protein